MSFDLSRHVCAAAFLLLPWAFVPGTASARLYDPNNNCTYQPGSTECQPNTPPAPPQVGGTPYEQFLNLTTASGIDMSQHGSYSEAYFDERARAYCGLLADQNIVGIQTELLNVPSLFEPNRDLQRIEVAILRVAAINHCPDFYPLEQQFEATYVR